MKVLLLNINTIKPLIAPLGLEYVGEYLKNNGIIVSVFDFAFQKGIKNYINRFKPDFIGISIRNIDDCAYPSSGFFLPKFKRLLNYIKTLTSAPFIVGGVGFSVMPEETLKYLNIDYGIHNDGEEAFLKFIEEYPYIQKIPNLIYRENNKYIKNELKFFDLKQLHPKRELFDNPRYFKEGGMGSVETKRGCIKNCIYCADILSKGKCIRLREPESVVEEIERLYRKGINYFHLCDSEFNIPYQHSIEICKAIIKKRINKEIFWYCYCAPREFDAQLAELMKEAGCAGINFGVDSGNDRILKNLGRDFTSKDLIKLGKICHKTKITFMFDLLFGAPDEDEQTVRNTIKLMKEIKPDVVGTAIGIRIYNNTMISEIVKKQGLTQKNKNLYGFIKNNENFLKPIFYISAKIGSRIFSLIEELTTDDKRFLFSYGKDKRDYNYNQNLVLLNAIKKGYRGAFWDILRRLQ